MTRVVATAATGVLREDHYVLNPVTSAYERSTLVEVGSSNICLRSENFGTTWTASGTPTRTAAAHTASGVTLDLIGDDSGAAVEYYFQNIAFTGNAVKAISVFVKRGTIVAAAGSLVKLQDNTAVATRLSATVTFTGNVPSVTAATGTYLGSIALADGVYRLLFTTTSVTAANTNELSVQPAGTLAQQGNIYAGGVQAENNLFPTSYLATTTATVSRNADQMGFSALPTGIATPREMTVYLKMVERGCVQSTNARVLEIGDAGSSVNTFRIYASGTVYVTEVCDSGGATVGSSTAAATPAYGDLVELRAIVSATPTVQLGQAINGAAEVVATASSSFTLPTQWGTGSGLIRVGHAGSGANPGTMAILAIKIAQGTKTLAEMRALADMASTVLVLNAGSSSAIYVPCETATETEAVDVGSPLRAFAGNERGLTRDQKRQATVTTGYLSEADKESIQSAIANRTQLYVSGTLFDNDTLTASVKMTNCQSVLGTPLWQMTLQVSEV